MAPISSSSSDPPERQRRSPPSEDEPRRSTNGAEMRGRDGDPPTSPRRDERRYWSEPEGRTRRGAVGVGFPGRRHREESDLFSATSVSSRDCGRRDGAHPAPLPSALRNGHRGGGVRTDGGGINYQGHGSGGTSRRDASSRRHVELRSQRLASSRRVRRDEGSSCASASSRVSFVPEPQEPRGTAGAGRRRFLGVKLSPSASSALVGVLALLGVIFQPGLLRGGLDPPAPASRTRVLQRDSSSSSAGGSSSSSSSLSTGMLSHEEHARLMTRAATSQFLDDFDQRRRRAADLPDGTVFDEPAHARMCRAIVERLDSYDAGTTSFEQVIFTESEYVCRDPDAPYTSVLNMFAAQLLHVANNDIGLNVDYTHRCAKWERFCTGNLTTVQFHLPDPLSINAYAFQPGCVDAPALRTMCEGCLASEDPTNPECVLFPDGYLNAEDSTCNLGCQFSQVLPWIRNNLRTMATNWLNTVESRALTFWLRNAAEFSHREKDDMEVSVVALSCGNDDCDMSMSTCTCPFDPLPNWAYAMHIPRSSTNVAIVVTPTCAKFGEGCTLHAQELYHFFHQLYPRSDVTYNVITSTSSWYMRTVTADHLVCPPGVGCLIPAIARDAYTYVYEKAEAGGAAVSTWLTCSPQDYLNRLTVPSFPPAFLDGDCRHLRARVGSWASDAALAPTLQYDTAVDGYLGCADANFASTAEEPYRAPTTYRWDETIWATCPVDVMTKDALCTEMDRLGLTRILFVGDHTTMTQAISLASILDQNDAISLDPNVVPNFTKNIACTGTTTVTSFELSYVRNDRLEEPGTTPSPGFPNCGPTNEQYCYPWSSDYAAFAGKQLLIVNTGYHWGDDWQGYITNFQNFVGKIDEMAAANAARANDVVMFRTSIPGHKECHLHDGVYAHYGEYCPRIVNGAFWHWWGELPPYNDYAIRIINEWNLLNTVKSGPDIELLDPWMMTVLRPDGHLSGSDAGPNCVVDPQECMLYSLPGPVDWWNHLLLMQLRDAGTHLENSNPMQAWR